MSDLIENKTRQLEHDSKNLDFGTEEEEETSTTVQPAATAPAQAPKNTSVPKTAKRQSHAEEKAEKLQGKSYFGNLPEIFLNDDLTLQNPMLVLLLSYPMAVQSSIVFRLALPPEQRT